MLKRNLHGQEFQFEIIEGAAGSWAIRAGISKFLVAEGSGWSRPIANEFLRAAKRYSYRSRYRRHSPASRVKNGTKKRAAFDPNS